MFHKVIVPLDGSSIAEAAIEPAVAAVRRAHGAVVFLRVPVADRILVPLAGTHGVLWPDQALAFSRQEARHYLADMHQRWSRLDREAVVIRTRLAEGDVASVIVDTALDEGADLISMSPHGYSGLTHWMLGSATEKVLSAAPCPVLVQRGGQPVRRMLISLDGSPLAEQALPPGLDLAEAMGAAVTLFRVVDQGVPADRGGLAELERIEKGLGRPVPSGADLRDEAEAYLRHQAAQAARPGLVIDRAVSVGRAAESLLAHVAANAIDLIAMATHGHTGLRRWIYGSVTEKVLEAAHCSMLIVRPAAHDLN